MLPDLEKDVHGDDGDAHEKRREAITGKGWELGGDRNKRGSTKGNE